MAEALLRAFEREVLSRIDPNVVVWQFYPNDEWDNVAKAVFAIDGERLVPLDATRNWLHRRQRLYARVPFRETLLSHSYTNRSSTPTNECLRYCATMWDSWTPTLRSPRSQAAMVGSLSAPVAISKISAVATSTRRVIACSPSSFSSVSVRMA